MRLPIDTIHGMILSVANDDRLLLHEIFEAAARRFPDRTAIDVPPSSSRPARLLYSYDRLQRHADAVAATLCSTAAPDAIVAILLPRNNPALYASQLGVLKAGAAFTCIDPTFPDEHLRSVLEDAEVVAMLTDTPGRERIDRLGIRVPRIIDAQAVEGTGGDSSGRRLDPSCLAYVIYTSGTTGKPKGVLIEHASIVNLVTSDIEYFKLTCNDRVAQCSSPAYDSSIEETWLALAAGATFVLLDDETVRLGPDLVPWLCQERITVFCPPPTLLRTMGCMDPQRQLPDINLLYVGGEALPTDLADRWSAGRWMENGYGPTECTVTVSRGRIRPGEPVTIGKPVRGHVAWVLDESLQEVPDGQPGELCIGGPGLARGYHKRDDLTAVKFPHHPRFGRFYRTADLVRKDEAGNLEYLGRIDAQVKLRGYRIELGAIEAHLAACAGVRAAACQVQGSNADKLLVAHIVPAIPDQPPDVEALKQSLRQSLPWYMVPSRFGFIDALPTTVGGKLDRKALPELEATATASWHPIVAPRNDNEQAVARAFARALRAPGDVSVEDDFFLDLGGDSLSAVAVICELRATNTSEAATVRDLYEARTAAAMAQRLRRPRTGVTPRPRPPEDRPRGRPLLCTMIQSLWLAGQLVAVSTTAYLLSFVVFPLLPRELGTVQSVLTAPLLMLVGLLLYTPGSIVMAVIIKKLLIGRYKPMRAPVWGSFFTRHWIVVSAAQMIPWWFLEGTVFLNMALRALGAKIGGRVHIHRGVDLARGGWDLLEIDTGATLAQDAALRLIEFDDGHLIVGPIRIGQGATVDIRAGMSPNSVIEPNGYLAALSWLPQNGRVPPGELWDGVPSTHTGRSPERPSIAAGRELSPMAHGVLLLLARSVRMLVSSLPIVVIALVVTSAVTDADKQLLRCLENPTASAFGLAVVITLAAASLAARLLLQAIAMRAMGRIHPGACSQWSLPAIRIWIKTGIVDSAGRWLSGSVLWPWWLRLAGMRLGSGCEISTIIDVVPETVAIGDESFFADGIYFCSPWRHRGTVTIADSTLGRNTFLGNHAVIPIGRKWPDGLFVGVSTVVDPHRAEPGSAWFGHPPMELPHREVVAADRRLTHEPGLIRYATRVFWELLRSGLPALPIIVTWAWYWLMEAADDRLGLAAMLLGIGPLLTLAAGASMCMAVIVLKWLLLGRVRPGQHAFWSCWCGRWDFLFVAWGYWARRTLALLQGTLLLNAFLRLTGMRIGHRVVLGRGFAQVVDPDMLTFEDDATVVCHFQAHSFEDRILKIDRIRVGRGATAGDNAVIFYGVEVGDRAWVAPHSVVMKRDILEPDGCYAGCPTRPMPDQGKTRSDSPAAEFSPSAASGVTC